MHRYTIEMAILLNFIYIITGIIILRTERGKQRFLGLIPIFLGGGTLIAGVTLDSKDIIMKLSMFWVGILLLLITFLKIINNRKCNYMVEAVFVDKNYYRGYKGVHSYGLVFRYTYNGEEYRSEAKQYFTEEQMRMRFRLKHKYKIYICENEPELCIVDKKDESVFSMTCIAIIFVFIALFVCWRI